MRRPVRSTFHLASTGLSRRALPLLCLAGLLLTACASPRPTAGNASLKSPPRSPVPAPAATANLAPGYRLDAARHLYGQNRDRIYAGVMPHYLRAVGVLEMDVDARGQVDKLRWLRAPSHAPEVMAEIERLVRQAAPYPAPAPSALQGGSARVIETWLWDQSGRFQLRTLSEGQGENAPTPPVGATQLAAQGGGLPSPASGAAPTATQSLGWQPVRVHLVAADGR
ncbi:hypothetical protein [Hylemonella gracilis]|uniref:TonB family protein n=1 Tax=Hylemonella gracilis ATCC 19624 TaxID=887062 RepID=F3KSP7_9BURK|nr:hypothetical protein HGR_07381 [Hylemonella gracilis ATCC 19624]